ncbi:MAG: hypothetical protein WEA56_08940 [Balneolaceae bacterium]
MLTQLYIILSLLVFFFLIISGSAIEPAMIKSMIVFSSLVVITKLSSFLIDIISDKSAPNKDANTSKAGIQ